MIALQESLRACSGTVPPWVENPYRLVSLGEMMRRFQGFDLVQVGILADQAFILQEVGRDRMTESWWEWMFAALPQAKQACDSFNLIRTADAIGRLEIRLHSGEKDLKIVADDLRYIRQKLTEELDACLFLHVPNDAHYYQEPQEGWQDVLVSFPSAMLNIEEASKCFALNRYTAAVFHCMRILESGIRVLANQFGVPADYRDWGNIIDNIESEIKAKTKALGTKKWPDHQFYSEAAVHLFHLKDAWRNHVIHGRLDFDEERARTTYEHTRDFMCHLALRLKE